MLPQSGPLEGQAAGPQGSAGSPRNGLVRDAARQHGRGEPGARPRDKIRKDSKLMSVFVVDRHKKPLMPCSEKRARLLLERGKAVVHRRYPFTIRLKERVGGAVQPVRLKVDPGAQ